MIELKLYFLLKEWGGMKNIDISNELLRRLYLVSLIGAGFIIVLFVGLFMMGAKNEENKLSLINKYYASLSVNKIDSVFHDLKISQSSKDANKRLNEILSSYSFVEAIYVLDDEKNIKESFAKNNIYINKLMFYGLAQTKNDFFVDKFSYNNDDRSFLLLALEQESGVLVALLDLGKLSNELFGAGVSNFLLDKDGYIFGANKKGNIYDEFSLKDDFKEIKTGLIWGGFIGERKLGFYSITHIDLLGISVVSQRFFIDIFSDYGTLSGLGFCVLLLFGTILFDLIFYTRQHFVVPLFRFRDFFEKLHKNQLLHYDFANNKDFDILHSQALKMFFESRYLKNRNDAYEMEHELLFEHSDMVILYVDAKDGRIVSCSSKALEFYGYDKTQMLTKTLFDLEESSLYDFYSAFHGKFGEDFPVTNVHLTAKNEKKYVQLSIKPVIKGASSFHIIMVVDMTKLVELGGMVKDIENISGLGPTLIIGIDKNFAIKQISDNVKDVIRFDKKFIIENRLPLKELIVQKDKFEALRGHLEKGTKSLFNEIIQLKMKDGSVCWFRVYARLRDEDGILAYVFLNNINVLYDQILDQKEALQRYEEQLQGSTLMVWEYDIDEKHYIFPSGFFNALEEQEYTANVTQSLLLKYISADYVKLLESEIQKAKNKEDYTFDIEILANNKQKSNQIWLRFQGHFAKIGNEGMQKPMIVGIIENITEKIKTDARLNLLANIFSSSREGILIADKNKKIIEVNDSFTRITGSSKEEVINNKNSQDFLRDYVNKKELYDAMWKEIGQNLFWRGEISNIRDNKTYQEMLSISAIKDKTGNISNYIGIFTDITELKNKEKQLEQIAFYDGLTGLANKTKFMSIFGEAINKVDKKINQNFALLYMDLDGFKAANDTYGHSCGDEVLKDVARRLESIKNFNGRNDELDIVSRIGGDEFVAIINNTSKKEASEIADLILELINQVFVIGDYNVKIGTTIGITYYPQKNKVSAEDILEQGDWAMYQAKLAGKNCYYEFDESSSVIFRDYKALLSRLESFDENNFELFYEPIYDVKAQKICAYEAQLRLKDEITSLGANDLANILSQKYWFSDLNIWIIQNALADLAEAGGDIIINTPISQLNSNTFFKKFADFAGSYDISRIKILLCDIFSARNPESEIAEIESKYKEFGVKFVVDEIDERTAKFIEKINIKDFRASKNYTTALLDDYHNIDKLYYILSLCASENRKILAKYITNPYVFRLLCALGFKRLAGEFICPPLRKDEILGVELNTNELSLLASRDNVLKDDMISFYKFIVFNAVALKNLSTAINNNALRYFDFGSYHGEFVALKNLQNPSLAWACDDAYELIADITNNNKNSKEENLNNIINQKLKLLQQIIGE